MNMHVPDKKWNQIWSILGRLVFLVGSTVGIGLAGGDTLTRHPIGLIYMALWNVWWAITFIGRKKGQKSAYDQGQKWLVILSGSLSIPYMIVVPALEYAHFTGPIPRNGMLSWTGLVVFAIGIAIQAVAMWQLRSFYTIRLNVKPDQALVTTGLYRRIRHPGYLSNLVAILGIGLAMSSIAMLILTIFIFALIHFRINSEEKMLMSAFGDQYRQYSQETWRLMPYIY